MCAEPNAESDVLNGLSNLIEQSLVQPTSDAMGETRFSLLETIRADALHRLDGSGEGGRLRERHADNYLQLAEEAEPHLVTAQRLPWLRRLDVSRNTRRPCLERNETAILRWGARCSAACRGSGTLRGHLQEGRMWAERLLALTPDGSVAHQGEPVRSIRVAASFSCKVIQLRPGRPSSSASPCFRLKAIARRLSYALSLRRLAHAGLREPLIALQMYNECLELARASGDSWLAGVDADQPGCGHHSALHDLTIAEEHYRAGLTLFEQLDHAWGRAIALRALGGLAVDRGDAVGARVHYERSVQLFRQTGDIRGLAQALLGLGRLALRSAEPGYARDVFVEALARWQELGILEGIIRCLSGLADVAAAVNQPDRSARLYAAVGVQAARISVVSAAARHERAPEDPNCDWFANWSRAIPGRMGHW